MPLTEIGHGYEIYLEGSILLYPISAAYALVDANGHLSLIARVSSTRRSVRDSQQPRVPC
jgi:hypothetical protein